MTRAMIQNMVMGVTKGYEKKLEIDGVGWNAAAQGNKVVLNIGLQQSRSTGARCPRASRSGPRTQPTIIIFGADKQAVGDIAADDPQARSAPSPTRARASDTSGEIVSPKKQGRASATAT